MDDVIHSLYGATVFPKLDLKSGYNQITLSEESRCKTEFSSLKGVKQFTRLNFGTNSASKIFQHVISERLHRIPGVLNITLPYRCSVSATTLETTIRHPFLSIAFLAQSLMPIPAYLETLSTQLVLFLPRPLVPSTIPSTNDFCMLL